MRANDIRELTVEDMKARIAELDNLNFGVAEEPMAYKGVTWDEGAERVDAARERAAS